MKTFLIALLVLWIGVPALGDAPPRVGPQNGAEMVAWLQTHLGTGVDRQLMTVVDLGAPPAGDFAVTLDWATMSWRYSASDAGLGPSGAVASCIVPQAIVFVALYLQDPGAFVNCPFTTHTFPNARTLLACVGVGGGLCIVQGQNQDFANFGSYHIVCVKGTVGAAAAAAWPGGELTTVTGACQLFLFGANPTAYNNWYAICTAYGIIGWGACAVASV